MQIVFQFLLLGVFLFTPINTPVVSIRDVDKTPETLEKERAKRKYFHLLAMELNNKFGVTIEPYEWPCRHPEIYYISYTVHYPTEIITQEQSRDLIVDLVSFVLSYVNTNPEVAPFLSKYPMTPKEVSFGIIFDKNLEGEDGWAGTNLINGVVHYSYIYQKVKVPSETFEEAKAKVAASRM